MKSEERMKKPPYLYHGSPQRTNVLTPRPARGVGPEKDRLCAVYASHVREFVIPFALPIVPDERGNPSWTLSFSGSRSPGEGRARVVIKAGRLDLSQVGYLYRVPSDTFEPVDDLQWVSYAPVRPLDCEIISPADYLDMIEGGEITGERGAGKKEIS